VLGGLLNMGVFLRQGGEFLVTVTGLQQDYLKITMTALLVAVAVYTIVGGMLSVLVTDYLQFIVMSVGIIAVSLVALWAVPFHTMAETVEQHYGAGGFNPLVNPNLGWSYIVFQFLLNGAAVLAWQTMVARVLAAKDAKTGGKIYTRTSFFFVCQFVLPGILGIAALATLSPEMMAGREPTHAMPLFLSLYVPMGLMGLLIAGMLAADMSTDSSYMLTWASVIYNDLLAPLRRRGQWSDRKGLLINRLIVAAIGVFLLAYGLWYELEGEIWTYLTLTGSIYLSSMSVLLIACCYWSKANNWGAMAAIAAGALFPLGFLVCQKLPATAEWAAQVGPNISGIAAFGAAATAMVVGSLAKLLLVPADKGGSHA
jgi:solute:Na+ symporter, SSS family